MSLMIRIQARTLCGAILPEIDYGAAIFVYNVEDKIVLGALRE